MAKVNDTSTPAAFGKIKICAGDHLAREITLLAGQINAANHRLLKLIAEFDRSKGWSGGGTVRSCAHWLNWQCGIALPAAREKVRVAHCLEELPEIDAAFASGEISYSKVRAMTRAATPENEEYLLMIARHGTASHVEQVVGKYRAVRRGLDGKAEREQRIARELVCYQDEQGMWVIHGRLPPEAGELVVKAIDAALAAECVENAKSVSAETCTSQPDGSETGTGETRPAYAAPEAAAKETAATHHEHESLAQEEPRSLPQKRADALERLAEHFIASADTPAALKGSERCQVQLHVSLDALRGAAARDNPNTWHCHLGHDNGISPATARRLCCDASLVSVLQDDRGNVLNIGRRSRTVPPAIRRALALRDHSCRVPGCCESKYVDAHHVVHWADGGETSLDNLVTLCRRHHRALHEGVFTIKATGESANRQFVFHDRAGKVLQESIFPQFPDSSEKTFPRKLPELAPGVTARSSVPHWQGEHCDYSMAIHGLLRRDGRL